MRKRHPFDEQLEGGKNGQHAAAEHEEDHQDGQDGAAVEEARNPVDEESKGGNNQEPAKHDICIHFFWSYTTRG